jgi:predicted cupin superfamily sugar epimerase
MKRDAACWICALRLRPHPEGGYYREVYRSKETIPRRALPARFAGPRAFGTAIYFLLRRGECSRLHRIRSDELWHHYAGAALEIAMLGPDGRLSTRRLGRRPEQGEVPLVAVPHGVWFGARVVPGGAFTLAGCTVAPGFEFADLELADRGALSRTFPAHRRLIAHLTRASTTHARRA